MNTIEKQIREHQEHHTSLDERITAEIRSAMGGMTETEKTELGEWASDYAAKVKAAYLEVTAQEALKHAQKIQPPTVVYEKFRPFMIGFYTLFLMAIFIPVGIGTHMAITLLPLILFFYLLNRSLHPLMTLTEKGLLLNNHEISIPWASIREIKTRDSHADNSVLITLSLKEECNLPRISNYGRIFHSRKKHRIWIHSNMLNGIDTWSLERLFSHYHQNQYLG